MPFTPPSCGTSAHRPPTLIATPQSLPSQHDPSSRGMTIFLPLEADSPFPQSPPFLSAVPDPSAHVAKVVTAVLKAKRIAVVCGAGISVQAGIPDFRSADGLFQSIKRDNPREALSSGKDLFDASVFNAEHTTAMFCQMIARLSDLSSAANPTPFHELLRTLDNKGKLLRVYTQNIDALELKAGLTFGVPGYDYQRTKSKVKSAKGKCNDEGFLDAESISAASDEPGPSRLPSPAAEVPRCIPLHGTLQQMHCQVCTHSFPLQDHLEALASGVPPDCPECTSLEATRQLVGKRLRGVGKLRPSVVLYNEDHRNGEGVGEVARKDLVGGSRGKGRNGADLLLVVGTSLRVPGTKRIVREFSKAIRSRSTNSNTPTSKPPTPSPSPRRSPSGDDEPPIKTIYLNFDFPVPMREWDGVFDVWIQGDAQKFASVVGTELEKEARRREAALEKRRRKREEAEREKKKMEADLKKGKKRKADEVKTDEQVVKKRRVILIVRPPVAATSLTKPQMVALAKKSHRSPSTPKAKHKPTKSHSTTNFGLATPLTPHTPPKWPVTKRPRSIPEVLITIPPPPSFKTSPTVDIAVCTLSPARPDHTPLTPTSKRNDAHVPSSPRSRRISALSPPCAGSRNNAEAPSRPAARRLTGVKAAQSVETGFKTLELELDQELDVELVEVGLPKADLDATLVRTLQYGLRTSQRPEG